MGLTPKQKLILEFIVDFGSKNGFSPSQQEIARHFGFKSLGTVQNYLVRLERDGALQKVWNSKRGLKLVGPAALPTTPPPSTVSRSAVTLPLLGRVAAGRPIETIPHEQEFEVPLTMLKKDQVEKGAYYVLKVVGDSMIEDGILEGDYVVVNRAKDAVNGQTVVALVNEQATVKRYFHKKLPRGGSRIELRPANPKYEPLVIESLVDAPTHHPLPELRIEGIVVGVIRHL